MANVIENFIRKNHAEGLKKEDVIKWYLRENGYHNENLTIEAGLKLEQMVENSLDDILYN